jgi:hypothetical protein
MCFYYARKDRWGLVGILGSLLAVTRLIGVFVLIPLVYEYLKSRDFKLNRIRPEFLCLLLIPASLLAFMAYDYFLTGDPIAFAHAMSSYGRNVASNPVYELIGGLIHLKVNAVIVVACFLLITVFYRQIGFTYWLVGALTILVPMTTGIAGMHRYTLVIFPMYIVLAKLSKNKYFDQAATVGLCLLQGAFMVIWTNELGIE